MFLSAWGHVLTCEIVQHTVMTGGPVWCSFLRKAPAAVGRQVCGPHLHPQKLDVLPLLRHGRALGVCGGVPSFLGLCQSGMLRF